MNYAQALEGYHRRRLNRTSYSEETFDEYVNTILEPLTGRIRRLAKRALRHANEVSLEDRIKDVIKLLPEPAASIVEAGGMEASTFANRAAGIRNIYAHNLPDQPPHSELIVFTYQLKTLVEAVFLHEVGFDPTFIDAKLRGARAYNLIKQMAERQGGTAT